MLSAVWCPPTMFLCFLYISCRVVLNLCCRKHLYLSVVKLIDCSVVLAVSCGHKLLFEFILIPWKTVNISLYKRQFTQSSILSFIFFYSYLNLCFHDIVHFEWHIEVDLFKSQLKYLFRSVHRVEQVAAIICIREIGSYVCFKKPYQLIRPLNWELFG